jgi:catechol 2,3-dioxygenase-like lactoylglutathione lyase family enzyme
VIGNPLGLKLNRITARVRDIDRAIAWYRDKLGFKVGATGVTPNGLMKFAHLHLPGFGISLVQLDMPATELKAGEQALPCWVHPVFEVSDPHSLHALLRQRGVGVFTRGPLPDRIFTFLVNDSEGNEIEIVSETGT